MVRKDLVHLLDKGTHIYIYPKKNEFDEFESLKKRLTVDMIKIHTTSIWSNDAKKCRPYLETSV